MIGIPTIFQAATSADTEKIEIEQLLGALDITDAFDIETTINGKPQPRVFNVKDYLPTWLVDEHDNGNTLFVKFMQYYYDWLYNPEISNIYNNRVFDFIDIEKIIDPMVTTALNSHVPGLAAIFETYGYKPHLENVKSLIKNIKRDIYQRKGTSRSVSLLFGVLFPEVESAGYWTDDVGVGSININLKDIAVVTGSDGEPPSSGDLDPQGATAAMITDIFREFIEPAGLEVLLTISAGSPLDEETEDQSDEDYNAS